MILEFTVYGVVAFGCFVAAALGVSSRMNLMAAGLAVWMLSVIV